MTSHNTLGCDEGADSQNKGTIFHAFFTIDREGQMSLTAGLAIISIAALSAPSSVCFELLL